MFANTDGNWVSALMLGSQSVLSTAAARSGPAQSGVCALPAGCFDDLGWIGRACQDLCDQGVRIQRNRRYQLVEFVT